jgi:tetratricopeptide (TPR) repeat protein
MSAPNRARRRKVTAMRILRTVLSAAAALLAASLLSAQVPEKFTNLQVLPKDIQREELTNIMRGFSFSLGMRCESCHVAKTAGSLEAMDFALDTKDKKKTARAMLRMVDALNRDYVAKLEPATATRVECGTCHHGLNKPRPLQAVLNEELEKKDLAAALALYRDLRKKYYGGAQYDFSEAAINQLTESLMAKRKVKEAAAFMELNAENSTLTGWGRSLLAMAHRANGETDKAIADFQKIVELNPGDSWAKKQLEDLKGGKK